MIWENRILIFTTVLGLLSFFLNFFYKNNFFTLKSFLILRFNFVSQTFIFASLAFILISRGVRLERLPWANFYESLLILASLANFVYWIFYFRTSKIKLIYFSKVYFLIFFAVCAYALLMPENQKDPLPLVPSLKSYWIIIHVPLVIFSYVFFLFSGFFSLCFLFFKKKKNKINTRKQEIFFRLLIDFIKFGFFFLTLGLITGALWANQSWGSLWQWDPKENLALATWFAYLIILHLYSNNKASETKIAFFSFLGFICFLVTYLGINYLDLGGLHSYGEIKS